MKRYLLTLLILFLLLLYLSNFTAIGVVADTRFPVVILAVVLTICTLFFAIREKKIHSCFNVILALGLLGLAVNEYFFQYEEEELVFKNDGYSFYGSLYTPTGTAASCVVIFLHGSGRQSRKEYAFHARQLARNGVAGYAYDKRGSGKSGGDTYEGGYQAYARDAVAAIRKLKEAGHFSHIGLFAISEGEWVSMLVDSLTRIDFIAIVSASGTTPLEQTHRELTSRLEQKGFGQKQIQQASRLYYDILTYDNDSLRGIELEKGISEAKTEPWFAAGEDFQDTFSYYPWWHQVMHFSPAPLLEKSDTPILVMVGKNNESYPFAETVENYADYPQVETRVFENGDHALLNWPLGQRVPPPTFAKGYLAYYTEWIKRQCGNQ